ncbi:MAG: MurR/RpiR family transcriptional regulator [Erysipelotrichaceae bacterium]
MYSTKFPVVMLSIIASEKDGSVNCQIANYILDHLNDLQEISITELAARCFVSNSSISRFCRDIGLQDFHELKEIIETHTNHLPVYDETLDAEGTSKAFTQDVVASLNLAVDSLDVKGIEALAKDIASYDDIAIFGMLKAQSVALNLQNDLLMLGKKTTSKVSFSQQMQYFKDPEIKRLFIVFSYTGAYFDYSFPVDFFGGKRKSKIYFITSDPNARSKPWYDRVISFQSNQDYASHPFQLQLIASLISLSYAKEIQKTKTT